MTAITPLVQSGGHGHEEAIITAEFRAAELSPGRTPLEVSGDDRWLSGAKPGCGEGACTEGAIRRGSCIPAVALADAARRRPRTGGAG